MSTTDPLHNASLNPALAPFDISSYTGVDGENFFDSDGMLRRVIERFAIDYDPEHRNAMIDHLHKYGKLCGGILNDLTIEAHKEENLGQIEKYDRTGNRIDRVVYSPAQIQSRKISYEHGIVNLDEHTEWNHPFSMLHRMALGYLANQNGEGGVSCPLAMTDGMIRVIRVLGTEEQKNRYLPMIAGQNSNSHFMCGQYVTERVGGSNVAQNRTIARKQTDGKWILNGEKWFCSNPGDLWVTTARIEDTASIGMFLVPRIKVDGKLNGCHLLRKKAIIGSRGKLTAEAVFEDCEAEELGRPSHGLANLIKYVIQTSRLHVAVAAIGMSRRAFVEARAYVRVREAYGKKIEQFPAVQRNLAEMQILHSTITFATFRNFLLSDSGHAAATLLTPLMKYASTVHATWMSHQAILLHGGNGILDDFSVLPRLHNDAIINETWEGTHQIISEHTLKAFLRPRIKKAYFDLIESNLNANQTNNAIYKSSIALIKSNLDFLITLNQHKSHWVNMNRTQICDRIYQTFALSELVAYGKSDNFIINCARGFAEINTRGLNGSTDPEGVFANPDVLQMLIDD